MQEKLTKKYDQEIAAQCMHWIADVTGEPLDCNGDTDSVYEALRDGYVLTKLLCRIKGNSEGEKKLTRQKMAFKQMEQIEKFTVALKGLEVKEHSLFATTDLFEKQNMVQVITCLESLGRKCHNIPCCPVKGLGPKESEANKRSFTEEQLAEGKSIIGLQMGSNKGANQSGQSFGKSRHIVD